MNTFTLLLLAAALVAANSSTLRGAPALHNQDEEPEQDWHQQPARHRKLRDDSSCTLYRKCTTFEPTEEHPMGSHKDSWVCELSDSDSRTMKTQFVDIMEYGNVINMLANATSGDSLEFSEAILDTDSPRMFIPDNARLSLGNAAVFATERRPEKRRQLQSKGPPTKGTLKTLVIRVKDKNNVQTTSSLSQLVNDVFTDKASLKTQTEKCSYGKLKIEPFSGKTPDDKYISNGVVDVKMDFDIKKDKLGMEQAAMSAAKDLLGDLNDPMFDLVMFCFPPGAEFLAFAYPDNKYSFYNDKWCGYVSAQMHEVGHNLGLAHSGQEGQGDYGDQTGMMGSSADKDDQLMCYNSQKNFQLGWYDDKVVTINPLDGVRRVYDLNGVSDYKKNSKAKVVVRMKQLSSIQDYYIGFNRMSGINSDTSEDFDKVTILRKESGAPDEYGQSTKVAALVPGQKKVIKKFDGKKDVTVLFVGVKDGNARIIITDKQEEMPPPIKGHCKKFTVEINTDAYPDDTSWFIIDNGGYGQAAAYSPVYTKANTKHRTEICLNMGPQAKTYKFSIMDNYKDGMCCNQGNGSYKIFDSNNNLIISGGEDFDVETKMIQIPKDPNPLKATKAPTPAPTAKPTLPPPCVDYTVEVVTDKYPQDTGWKILSSNAMNDKELVEESHVGDYDKKEFKYTKKVCLTPGMNHDFEFIDHHGDGMKGSYRIMDQCGKAVVQYSSNGDDEFRKREETFKVTKSCGGTPDPPPPCKDRKGKFKLNRKSKKKGNCKFYAKTKKCSIKKVWQRCRKSCNKCLE